MKLIHVQPSRSPLEFLKQVMYKLLEKESPSEQQLVDCAGSFNNYGCNGGLPSQDFEYIKYNDILETEEAYPYTGNNGLCKYSTQNIGAQVLDSVDITLGAQGFLKCTWTWLRLSPRDEQIWEWYFEQLVL
ncbi:Pro-cathepsin H [Linum perenne]